MDKQPLITIITVCFNAEKEIEKTIQSVLGQTFEDYEYLVIDGGSKDGTLDIIKKYASNSKLHWISEPDNGIYDAMNKGIDMAKGTWLNMMNSGDTFVSNDVLQRIFSSPIPNSKSFIYSDNYYIDDKGRKTYSKHDHTKLSILHQSSIYRKELHKTHGYYIVTPKIIVSDLLFFAAIPENEFLKVDIPISCNLIGGVSTADWCVTQALCAKVVFRKMTFCQMLLHYVSAHLKMYFPILQRI